MNAVNYNALMEKEIASLTNKPRLLLHCCCAPCSSACLERLNGHFDITVLFYNPNIEDEEYFKRKKELMRLVEITGWAKVLDCDHDTGEYYRLIAGLEGEKEGGKRCAVCFELRLEKTAALAEAHGFDYFTTTLTISPLKDATLINAIGERVAAGRKTKWLHSDFKKKDGYLNSIRLSQKFELYRQDYCGCIYSQHNNKS